MRRGRPLRFLALVLGGWTTLRVAVLWTGAAPSGVPMPVVSADPGAHGVAPHAPSTPLAVVTVGQLAPSSDTGAGRGPVAIGPMAKVGTVPRVPVEPGLALRRESRAVDGTAVEAGPTGAVGGAGADGIASLAPPPPPAATGRRSAALSRLHGDTWLIARPSGGDSLAFGQLGASQAGMRVTYPLSEPRRVALSLRASTPLRGTGREAAAGLDWQPTRLPIHLLAEQRFAPNGGAARPAVQLIGGGSLRLPRRLAIEAYAQAGGVSRRGPFADGSARLSRGVVRRTVFTLDLGVGAWGAAQRRVARLDLGPTVGLILPARGGTVRLAADYRLRVAGRAQPGSGPAVSLGSSF